MAVSRTVQTAGHVWVEYRPGILLMLPIPATSLRPAGPRAIPTKLCLEALEDLVATAGESEGPCPSSPARSSGPCRRAGAGRSSTMVVSPSRLTVRGKPAAKPTRAPNTTTVWLDRIR